MQKTMASKTCSRCGKVKEVEEFNKHKSTKDGLRNHCKECQRADYRRYYQENLEKARERGRAKNRKHYHANRDKERERYRAYRQANLEKDRARCRQYKQSNSDKIREYQREYRRKQAMELSSRVRRIVPIILHFEGRHATLTRLAHILAKRKDFDSLCWLSADIEDLAVRYYYKEAF